MTAEGLLAKRGIYIIDGKPFKLKRGLYYKFVSRVTQATYYIQFDKVEFQFIIALRAIRYRGDCLHQVINHNARLFNYSNVIEPQEITKIEYEQRLPKE